MVGALAEARQRHARFDQQRLDLPLGRVVDRRLHDERLVPLAQGRRAVDDLLEPAGLEALQARARRREGFALRDLVRSAVPVHGPRARGRAVQRRAEVGRVAAAQGLGQGRRVAGVGDGERHASVERRERARLGRRRVADERAHLGDGDLLRAQQRLDDGLALLARRHGHGDAAERRRVRSPELRVHEPLHDALLVRAVGVPRLGEGRAVLRHGVGHGLLPERLAAEDDEGHEKDRGHERRQERERERDLRVGLRAPHLGLGDAQAPVAAEELAQGAQELLARAVVDGPEAEVRVDERPLDLAPPLAGLPVLVGGLSAGCGGRGARGIMAGRGARAV